MYHTIFIYDGEINNNVILAYADSYFKLGLSKLNLKIISTEKFTLYDDGVRDTKYYMYNI